MRLIDSELKVMAVILDEEYADENGEIKAIEVYRRLEEKYGWNKSTVYALLGKLLEKGAITRRYPNYTIRSLVAREELIQSELARFADMGLNKSPVLLFQGLLQGGKVNGDDLDEMKRMIEDAKREYDEK